jgi:hypothetical protein
LDNLIFLKIYNKYYKCILNKIYFNNINNNILYIIMVISTNNISLSSIQNEFGGINPIHISEYYRNSVTNYTSNISSLPTINNTIRFNMFSDLAKDINILYTTPGSYIYTVPNGIKTLCVLCVGGGAAGAYVANGTTAGGGGGGGLIWVNNIIVTTGQQFNIIVGNGGNGANGANPGGQNGSASMFFFNDGTTFNIQANGGISGGSSRFGGTRVLTNTQFTIGTNGGGNGGNGGAPGVNFCGGGGGAAGYRDNGGNGGTNNTYGDSGNGGGGAGGQSGSSSNSQGGGGVGILNGQGINGEGNAGQGGSGGEWGRSIKLLNASIAGGAYGGGGAGNINSSQSSLNRSGGRGAVRIMALGKDSNRSFPLSSNAKAF